MTDRPGHLQERVWQFRIPDEATVNCASYFAKRASELASALNCRLIAMSGVKVELRPGNASLVVGTALLENPRENVLAFHKAGRSPCNSRNLKSGVR